MTENSYVGGVLSGETEGETWQEPSRRVTPRVDSVLPGPVQGDAVGRTAGQILPGLWCPKALGLNFPICDCGRGRKDPELRLLK